jgi:hypothetical protein
MELFNKIDIGHIILIGTTVLSSIFGIWQLVLKRKFEKNDKLVDRRYEAYQGFMKLADEICNKIRTDPNSIFSLIKKYFGGILSDEPNESKQSLDDFNSELFSFTQKSLEPLQIVNAELNKLRLVCSKKLLLKINEFKELVEYLSNTTTSNINLITKDPAKYYKIITSLTESDKMKRMNPLWDEIVEIMRYEINNKN